MFTLGKPESRAGSAYSPSIIQEPEQDKAEVKQGPTQQGEDGGSGHHDADLGLRFHTTRDPFESRPMGKSDYLTPNRSLSCPEPWQGPQRPVVSEPHCIPPLENMEKDFFWQAAFKRGWAWGTGGGNPPCLGLRSGQESLTSLSKPQRGVPVLQVREERENTVPCSSTHGQAEPNLCSIPAASLAFPCRSQQVPDPCQRC